MKRKIVLLLLAAMMTNSSLVYAADAADFQTGEYTVSVTDFAALQLAIAMAEQVKEDQETYNLYTKESWAAAKTALDAARILLESPEVSQEEADEAFFDLMEAFSMLENKEQRVGLKAAIQGTQMILADTEGLSEYTPESVETVKKTLLEAQRIYDSQTAVQEDINRASTNLLTAVTQLLAEKKQGDTKLEILIQIAEKMLENADRYTADSVVYLKKILEDAKKTAANENASEAELEEAFNRLAQAILDLVGIEKEYLMGDVDLNGVVDTRDAAKLLRYAAELESLTKEQLKVADVTYDGEEDTRDAGRILKYAAELITKF